jgi:hypothetical protein
MQKYIFSNDTAQLIRVFLHAFLPSTCHRERLLRATSARVTPMPSTPQRLPHALMKVMRLKCIVATLAVDRTFEFDFFNNFVPCANLFRSAPEHGNVVDVSTRDDSEHKVLTIVNDDTSDDCEDDSSLGSDDEDDEDEDKRPGKTARKARAPCGQCQSTARPVYPLEADGAEATDASVAASATPDSPASICRRCRQVVVNVEVMLPLGAGHVHVPLTKFNQLPPPQQTLKELVSAMTASFGPRAASTAAVGVYVTICGPRGMPVDVFEEHEHETSALRDAALMSRHARVAGDVGTSDEKHGLSCSADDAARVLERRALIVLYDDDLDDADDVSAARLCLQLKEAIPPSGGADGHCGDDSATSWRFSTDALTAIKARLGYLAETDRAVLRA